MSTENNIRTIKKTIAKTAAEWNKQGDDITLIAVSKKQPAAKIKAALDCGHRHFGENRVQEAVEHFTHIRDNYSDITLHLIGPLQTNKVKDAAALFDVIHTVDREKLARKLSAEMMEQDRNIPCFIQVNIGEEEQKSGILPQDLAAFLNYCRDDCGLNIIGLMCIPPVDEPAGLYFSMLKNMARQHGLKELSMGMSSDYETAIAAGATYIRVGTGVFGDRKS